MADINENLSNSVEELKSKICVHKSKAIKRSSPIEAQDIIDNLINIDKLVTNLS